LQTKGMTFEAFRWFPDGKRLLFSGRRGGSGTSLFVQDVAGGDPRPLTAEGGETTAANPFVFTTGFAVSPDGKQVAARRPDGTYWLYPVDGGSPRPLPGIDPSSNVVRFDESGQGLYLATGFTSLRIDRYDM